MIKRYNNLSFLFFIPGMIIQGVGYGMTQNSIEPNPLALFLLLLGTVLSFLGFGYYAKAKGRSMAWGLCGFLSLLGLVILSMLKDKSGDPWNT